MVADVSSWKSCSSRFIFVNATKLRAVFHNSIKRIITEELNTTAAYIFQNKCNCTIWIVWKLASLKAIHRKVRIVNSFFFGISLFSLQKCQTELQDKSQNSHKSDVFSEFWVYITQFCFSFLRILSLHLSVLLFSSLLWNDLVSATG